MSGKQGDGVTVVEVQEVEAIVVGHPGHPACDVLIVSQAGQNIALRFSEATATAFLSKLTEALQRLQSRSKH